MASHRLAVLIIILLFTPAPVQSACIFGGGVAGESVAYLYAVAYINSISAADAGLKRISTVARRLKPKEDYTAALVAFTEALKEYELAARDFECAASIIRPQEKFSPDGSNVDQATGLAIDAAVLARLLYLQLAKETRGLASLFVDKMKGSVSDIEFAERMAKASANLHDIPRELFFSISPSVPHVLVDPKPDSSNRMSRLRITKKERDDLIDMLDKAFGSRVTVQVKGDRPAIEAGAAMLRKWLATTGHTPLP